MLLVSASLRAKRGNLASLAHARVAEIASSPSAPRNGGCCWLQRHCERSEAISLRLLMREWPRLLRRLRLLAMTDVVGFSVIASEAKQSRFACSCASGRDCFVAFGSSQ